ncbi:MAG: formylglycine-generating enzyme family protein [Flammeovirgaceae bacterium]
MKFILWFCCLMSAAAMAQIAPPTVQALEGSFPNFKFQHQGYFVEATEVSNALWWEYFQDIMEKHPENKAMYLPKNSVWKAVLPHAEPSLARYFGKKMYLDYPVVGISYEQALRFCKWRSEKYTKQFNAQFATGKWQAYHFQLNYRLPTATEWETWANQELKGRSLIALSAQINCRKSISSSRKLNRMTQPVTQQQIRTNGFYHLFGNVSEMTQTKGIAKGGNWMQSIEACEIEQGNQYAAATAWLGFRCILEVKITPKVTFPQAVFVHPTKHKTWYDHHLQTDDLARYATIEGDIQVPFAYEKDELDLSIIKAELEDKVVTDIAIVFTRYPYNLSEWRINYYDLLSQRITKLIDAFPALNAQSIRWKVIRQTDCTNREEAARLFHGFVITTTEKEPKETKEQPRKEHYDEEMVEKYQIALDTFVRQRPNEQVIQDYVTHFPERLNGTVVMDWTASMYPYACETILLNLKQHDQFHIQQVVFFNDGDDKKNWQKKIGETGGIYHAPTDEMAWVLQTMNTAKEAGNGGDIPENDLEALIQSIKRYPTEETTVLVADNQSPIRDFELLPHVTKPVHVILCGMRYQFYGKTIHLLNPQYVKLANDRNGSLYFENYEQFADRISDSLPKLKVNGHVFWVLDEGFELEGWENINFVFNKYSITIAEHQKANSKEINNFIEFNESNFPKLLELNHILNKYKSKARKKKKVRAKINNLMKQ